MYGVWAGVHFDLHKVFTGLYWFVSRSMHLLVTNLELPQLGVPRLLGFRMEIHPKTEEV